MTRPEITTAVERIVADVLSEHGGVGDVDVLSRDATLHDELGMDEADILEVMLRAETQFGVSLPDSPIGFSSTITDIVELVAARISDKQARTQAIEPPPQLLSPSLAPEVAPDAKCGA